MVRQKAWSLKIFLYHQQFERVFGDGLLGSCKFVGLIINAFYVDDTDVYTDCSTIIPCVKNALPKSHQYGLFNAFGVIMIHITNMDGAEITSIII